MYILDEPSIGLHSRDTHRLIKVLMRLRDLGNTVIVVEHDEEIIRAADQIIDIGPLAGHQGGEIVFQGTFQELNDRHQKPYRAIPEPSPVHRSSRQPAQMEGVHLKFTVPGKTT